MGECPVIQMTREQFNRPFTDYWSEYFKKNPDTAMVKVIPPKGWMPRRGPFQNLDRISIHCPTKQMVVGSKGHYIVLLIEQKQCTVADFKKLSQRQEHQAPKVKVEEDEKRERQFWKSVTINPPYYGADTPQSFFDENLSWGWNMRNLGCLLKSDFIPTIVGVSTPMTYFGMWKSFFAWHKEDADLYSMNYLHFGAPKVWYCVPPSEMAKFEAMAVSLYPEMSRQCPAFLRHKEVLVSPSILKTYGVQYVSAVQRPNEFIVLNAAAYHSGYNLGFNCAEAVNFALEEWIPLGLNATRCRCGLMKDGVRFNMDLFLEHYPQYRPKPKVRDDRKSRRKDRSRSRSSSKRSGQSDKSRSQCSHGSSTSKFSMHSPSKSDRQSLFALACEHLARSPPSQQSKPQGGLSVVRIQRTATNNISDKFPIVRQAVDGLLEASSDVEVEIKRPKTLASLAADAAAAVEQS